ncbi:hypothetical protein AAZX31_08G292900 [Glycine max]|uniref:uncharacterized protein n=1 Tax=Glycine max TaxID=3847 RepID=UPI00023389CA|nr:uncharacterized protein LOC100799111 [Glycine max]KAG5138279.1 hypothetical protein JHK82_023010 [Glycine max]KAH1239369.1 hypothetical protein GmHk_08G023821 [Glycine max]|eukprot:XP_003532068.1 uncharacterized protein LOC100799111 [Glycine max]
MATRVSPPVALLLSSLLFLLTLSRARDLPNPFSQPKPHSEPKTVSFTIDTIDPVPLTLLRFRPINRHFQPGRPLPLSLRTGHRRCRHRREIPYGNDAILVGDAAAASRIHPRWVRLHSAAETRFPATVERQDSDHDHDHEHHHQHHGERHHHHHRHKESWFAKKIRKFMKLF